MSDTGYNCTHVAAGETHSVAICNGRLMVWGSNTYGQVSLGGPKRYDTPWDIGGRSDWNFVDSHALLNFAIASGQLWGWGSGSRGQFGLGANVRQAALTRIGTRSDWESVSIGSAHVLAIASGKLFSWGGGSDGQLGLGSPLHVDEPVQVCESEGWTHVSAGASHSLGIREGRLFAWGSNRSSSLGLGDMEVRRIPQEVGGTGWTAVSAGDCVSAAIKGGLLYVWGFVPRHIIPATGFSRGRRKVPSLVKGRVDWTSVCARSRRFLGISNGSLYSWDDHFPRREIDSSDNGGERRRRGPFRYSNDFDWDAISSGWGHFLAIKNGRVYSWRQGSGMRLGLGDEISRPNPTLIEFP